MEGGGGLEDVERLGVVKGWCRKGNGREISNVWESLLIDYILTTLYVLQLSEEKSEYFKFLNDLVSWIPFNDRLVNSLIERLLDSLTDWLIDWLIDWFIGGKIRWSVNWLIDFFIDRLMMKW